MTLISTSRLVLASVLVASLGSPASQAQDFEDMDAKICRTGLFSENPPLALAKVVGDGGAHFYTDAGTCPEEGDCRKRAYLVPGDTVVVSKLRKEHVCSFYTNSAGGTAGYLPIARLQLLPTEPDPAQDAWLGKWSASRNPEVTISRRGDGLYIWGLATWPGPERYGDYKTVNTGELYGTLTVFGNRAHYDDGYCAADLTLLDNRLLISDNHRCGGLNVRFSAVYERQPPN